MGFKMEGMLCPFQKYVSPTSSSASGPKRIINMDTDLPASIRFLEVHDIGS